MSKPRLGIIQVRGIGDAIIALPIAEYYYNQGFDVFFALDDRFCDSFQKAAPYCTFVPVPFKEFRNDLGLNNPYWYELPRLLLLDKKCQHIISFPYHESHLLETDKREEVRQSLIHRLQGDFESRVTRLQLFKHLKFDEYKYATAKVPFHNKWKLNIVRDYRRERLLYDKVVLEKNKKLIVTHLEGSDIKYNHTAIGFDSNTHQLVNIDSSKTDNIFDWLTVIENSDKLILLDSVFCNLVEQLNLKNEKHFIRRSSIFMTPVLRNNWDYVQI